ncbi:hypothetical protein FRC00_010743 [Tulasnella sp. 408]|nr:hypothetical protein FRC00_010743 [Tulasnella sp. 408]
MHSVPLKVFAPVTAVLATLCFASVVAAIYLILQTKSNVQGRRQSQARAASPDEENNPSTSTAKRSSQFLQQLNLLKEREDGDNNIKQTSADDVEEPEKFLQAA